MADEMSEKARTLLGCLFIVIVTLAGLAVAAILGLASYGLYSLVM